MQFEFKKPEPKERRSEVLQLYFTPTEMEQIRSNADREELIPGQWARMLVSQYLQQAPATGLPPAPPARKEGAA